MNKDHKILFFVSLLAAVVLLTSCGGLAQPPEDDNSRERGGSPGESAATQEPQQSNTSGMEFEEGKLPGDFPEAFPVHPEARIGSAITETGLEGFHITLSSTALIDEVLAFYQQELPLAGWTITGFGDTNRGTEMIIQNPDYEGELLFIGLESGVVVDVSLFLPDRRENIPGAGEVYGETTELGELGGDFPADFPMPLGAEAIPVPDKLMAEGYQLVFSYPELPEMAYIQLITGIVGQGWEIGEFVINADTQVILMPFTDPDSGFKGYALLTDSLEVSGMDIMSGCIIALHPGIP